MRTWARQFLLFPLVLGAACAGCHPQNHAEENALVGSTAGALLGGIIGHQSGHTGDGAVLGAMAGGLTGAIVGDAQDERDEAIAHAAYVESAKAVTNFDLVRMTQSGVSDDVIINTVKAQGGRIDLSPDAVIALKANGVSDHVVLEIQKAAQAPPPPEYVVTSPPPPPGVVVVHPVTVGVGFRRPLPPRHRHHPRTGVQMEFWR
jgi:uncharacterized protein YcfJ